MSSLGVILSSGVMWTAEVKQQLLDRIPQVVLFDAIGSTEGSMGNQMTTTRRCRRRPPSSRRTRRPRCSPRTAARSTPGSDEIGMVAAGGFVPLGYFKDPDKSARTFRMIDGVRYSFPGDLAQVAADGTLILLGRGSQVINSGGEKIFPEEVEEAVKRVPGVRDCLVVGVDDERFGAGGHGRCGDRRHRARRGRRDRPRQDAAGAVQGAEASGVRRPRCHAHPTARPTTTPPSSTPSTPSAAPEYLGGSVVARHHVGAVGQHFVASEPI